MDRFMENNGFVFGQLVIAAKALGVTSEEVASYQEEHYIEEVMSALGDAADDRFQVILKT